MKWRYFKCNLVLHLVVTTKYEPKLEKGGLGKDSIILFAMLQKIIPTPRVDPWTELDISTIPSVILSLHFPTAESSYPGKACASISSEYKKTWTSLLLPYVKASEEFSLFSLFLKPLFCPTELFLPQSRPTSSLSSYWYFPPAWTNPFCYLSICVPSSHMLADTSGLLASSKSPRLISPLFCPWSSSPSPCDWLPHAFWYLWLYRNLFPEHCSTSAFFCDHLHMIL